MVILYMVFLLPLTVGAYYQTGYGEFCPDFRTTIPNQYDCQVAAHDLSLNWGGPFSERNGFPACLHTRDRRDKVYFNVNHNPATNPTSQSKFANYAAICTGAGPDKHYGLVVTGGDNPNRIASSELITSTGVCVSPDTNIPELQTATSGVIPITGAKSVWIEDGSGHSRTQRLMLCGGSETFMGGDASPWAVIDTCWKVKPGDANWQSAASYKMTVARGWFSLNNINEQEAVAAGGMSTGGVILKSMEKYSGGVWRPLTNIGGHAIELPFGLYGHCAVQYTSGPDSLLMIIGGSSSPTTPSAVTNAVTVINLNTGIPTTPPAGALPKLWAPACTKKGEDIFVSGGAPSGGHASKHVYKGTIGGSFVRIGSGLSIERSGHTMGVASTGNPGKLVVAGGFYVHNGDYLKIIESSTDNGETWTTLATTLTKGGEYAAMACVPPFAVGCGGPWSP